MSEKTIEVLSVDPGNTASVTFETVVIYPVVYAGTNGQPGEYQASNNPDVGNEHRISIGKKVFAVFYQPFHNIGDLGGFSLLDVKPDGNDILLYAGSRPGIQNRIRLKITALVIR